MSPKPLLDIGDEEWHIVETILQRHVPDREVWAFGSRAKWTAKEFSDLDLAVLGEKSLTLDESSALADAFAGSDLPWKVDVVDWTTISSSFRQIIKRDKVVVQRPSKFQTLDLGMSSEWSQMTLGNLLEIKHGYAFKGEYFSEMPTPFQLTTPGNFAIGGGFQAGKGKFYNGPVPDDYVLKADDLLVTMTDLSKAADTLGYAAVVPKILGTTWLHNQRVGLISIKKGAPISEGFAHYLMRSPEYRHWVVSTATGSTVKHTSPSRICEFEFSLPPIEYQHEVAEILGALDDRITLLRETNSTLEAIAQALFKSWFVDFDPVHAKMQGRAPEGMDEATIALFPYGFEESELGSVPKGWVLSTVGKAFVLTMGQSPPGDTYNQKADGLPFYQGRTDFGFRFPTKRIYCNAPTRLAEIGDALVSVRAPVGDVNMAIETCCIGRGVAAVRHPDGCSGYTFYTMRNLGERFKNFNSEGTVFGSINKKDFEALPVLEPSHPVLLAFDKFSKALDGRIVINEEQIRLLVELRDALLPRLISGTLKVSSEESLVEGAR